MESCTLTADVHWPQTAQALALPNVYFVTYEQLRQWMGAPVPASQMQSWLKCNAVNFTAEGAWGRGA